MLLEMIDKFKSNNPSKQLILLYEAGSHFFDLNGPSSDKDYRGLYIDPHQDSFESGMKNYQVDYKTKIGAGKNSSEDVDFTLYSLTSFFKLLSKGDFNMMELLYAPTEKIIFKTPIYDELVGIRKYLIMNDISSFLGFIKKEYKRYGVNIFHYKLQEDFVNFLKQFPPHNKMKEHWNEIVEYGTGVEGIRFVETKINNAELVRMIPTINIAERDHQQTNTVGHTIKCIQDVLDDYGHRQKSMAASGVEFKGLYHALRLIYEANDIFDTGELIFPFNPERHATLKKIKNGEVDKDWLFDLIDNEILKLYHRETLVESNKSRIQKELFRLEVTLRGRLSVRDKIMQFSNKP